MSRGRRGTVWCRCTRCGRRINGYEPSRRHARSGCEGTRTSWAYRVGLGRDDDGRRIQVMRSGFATRASADRALRELLSAHDLARDPRPTRRTVEEYLAEWLEATAPPRVAPATAAKRRLHVAYVTPRLGRLALDELNPAALDQCYRQLARDGRRDGAGGLAPATIRDVHRTLSKALDDARRWQYLPAHVDPCAQADPPRADQVDDDRRAAMHTWTATELRRFLDATAEHPWAALWQLAARTGMRRSELLGLRWSDVDLPARRLRVAQKLVRDVHGWTLVQSAKSRAGARTIALDARTAASLTALRATTGPGGLVFTHHDGTPLNPNVVTATFRQLIADLDLPRIRLHALRHTHATHLLQAGVSVQTVSRRLGHATAAITLTTYSHVMPGDDAQAAHLFSEILDEGDR